MKKILTILCTVLLLLSLPFSSALGDNITLEGQGSTWGYIEDVCYYDGSIWFVTGNGVFRLVGNIPEQVLDLSLVQGTYLSMEAPSTSIEKKLWDQGIGLLTTDGTTLYGIHPYSGQISIIADGKATPILAIPAQQFFTTIDGYTSAKTINSVFFHGGKLYLNLTSYTPEYDTLYELYTWNLESPEMDKLDIPGYQCAWAAGEDTLLVRCRQSQETPSALALYSLTTGETLPAILTEDNNQAAGCVWNPTNDSLYYTGENGQVMQLASDGTASVRAYLPTSYLSSNASALITPAGEYITFSNGLFQRDVSKEAGGQQTLHISGYFDTSVAIAFQAQHPEVNLALDAISSADGGIQSSIVSGDGDIDLYIVSSLGVYQDIRDKGYAAPMNDNQQLLAHAQSFYPAIQKAIFADDQLMAFPLNIVPESWTLNQTQWDALELGTYPATFAQLFDALGIWQEEKAADYPDMCFVDIYGGYQGYIALLVKQYVLEHETADSPVTFDAPAFSAALQSAMDARTTLDTPPEGWDSLIMTYHQYLGVGYNDSNRVVSVAPPSLSPGTPASVSTSMDMFVLNPLSKQQEIALEFIYFYYSQLSPDTLCALSPAYQTPQRNANYETTYQSRQDRITKLEALALTAEPDEIQDLNDMIAREKENLSRYQTNSWALSQEAIDIYHELAQHLVVPTRTIFSNGYSTNDEIINQVITRFVDGQLTIDQFIKELNQKSEMMFKEGF